MKDIELQTEAFKRYIEECDELSITPDYAGAFTAAWNARAAVGANSVPDVENMLLRQMLAIRVAGAALYSDDGELQDNSAHPCIDFKRDPAELIHYKLKARLSASPAPAQQERKPMTRCPGGDRCEWTDESAANGWRSECRKCGRTAAKAVAVAVIKAKEQECM